MVSGHRAGVWGRNFGGIVICLLAIPSRVQGVQRVQQGWAKCLIFKGFGLLKGLRFNRMTGAGQGRGQGWQG